MEEIKLPGDDDEWIIDIAGYGAFLFRGNEDDAERMRSGKAAWEGSRGYKWRVDDPLYGLGHARTIAKVLIDERRNTTADALEFAKKYPNSVATWHNYGRSEASERVIEALRAG